MATFFGEVIDVHSRAVWWSDSEDEDFEESRDETFDLEVCDEQQLNKCRTQCKRFFVSVSRQRKLTNLNCLLKFKCGKDETASLYQINQDECWLFANSRAFLNRRHLYFTLVNLIFEKVLNSFQSNLDLLILSIDLRNLDYVSYMASPENSLMKKYLSQSPSGSLRPILAPQTLKNDFELAFLEHCIVNQKSFICLILSPTVNNTNNIPDVIVNSLNEFNGSLYSNLLT